MGLDQEVREGLELVWRKLVGEEEEPLSPADVAATAQAEQRLSGLYLLLVFLIACLAVFLPFILLICSLLPPRKQAVRGRASDRSAIDSV